MKTPIISFLASDGGTAARDVIGAINSWRIVAEVGVVICNNKDALIVQWCHDNGINVSIISGKTNLHDEDNAIFNKLKSVATDLVVLSGYRKHVNNIVLNGYENRILNIHPSLLPKHGNMFGDDIYKSVLESKDKVTGVTVHIVTDEYDSGPILKQNLVLVRDNDDVQSLGDACRATESELYIGVINEILPRLMEVESVRTKYENWINQRNKGKRT
jgi:phosphoribosylglycinamide formyltransferase-1